MRLRLAVLFCAAVVAKAAVTYRVKLASPDGSRIEQLSAEQYVAGVLAGESSVFQSEEAIKAMAIAARTYAAHMRSRHAAEGFDFCSTTHCQRFEAGTVPPRLLAAAQATAGQLLWYLGKPVFAVHSRDCGGTTESALFLWPDVDAPYLSSRSDPYCRRESPRQWFWNASPAQIVGALRASALRCPEPLQRVSILNRTASNRAHTLSLESPSGLTVISETSFRFAIGRALGWNLLRSDRYEVQNTMGRIEFHGAGEGHGVGLCQHGADEMGRQGYKYSEILAFYYPGTTIALSGTGLDWIPVSGGTITLFTAQPHPDGRLLALAQELCSQAASRLQSAASPAIHIYIYPDVETFRNATGEPGWVAAHTKGNRIDLQPFSKLENLGILRQTLMHELLHIYIEHEAAPDMPLWFREGLVAWLTHSNASDSAASGARESAMQQRENEALARTAYSESAARVDALVRRYGETTVLSWIKRGLPPDVKNASASSAATNSR
jgi:stage II sporulation protein D